MHNVVTSRRGLCYVGNPPIRNVYITSLPIARIVLILKAELFFADHTAPRSWIQAERALQSASRPVRCPDSKVHRTLAGRAAAGDHCRGFSGTKEFSLAV
jgi:hypothetical protein